jgi:NTE family protein
MTLISQIPLFAGISSSGQTALCDDSVLRSYAAGEVVLQAGEAGEFLFTIHSGTVAMEWNSSLETTKVVMGPGEIFGEMSLITGSTISATIIAQTSTEVFLTPSSTFHKLLAEDSQFLRAILGVLTRRLRVRTSQGHQVPICAFIALPAGYMGYLPKAVRRAVDRYVRVVSTSDRVTESDAIPSMKTAIDHWRALHSEGIYIVFVAYADLSRLRDKMREGDVVLIVETAARLARLASDFVQMKVDVATVRTENAIDRPAQADEVWSFSVTETDIRTMVKDPYSFISPPPIDLLARWIVRRCVGIALGAGGARGFAHLGVLKALENANIVSDFLSGSSIGGIISIFYGMTLSAESTYELTRRSLGSNRIVREVAWLPRTSIFRGRRVRQSAERAGGDLMLRDLKHCARALATDLISGTEFVLDSGSVAIALQATASIPGVFPAVNNNGRCLVDGALTSRIPVHLLDSGRCGLKIAVNIDPDISEQDPSVQKSLLRDLSGAFSIAGVIARSWDLMGTSQSQSECNVADVVIRPRFSGQSGFNFDAIEPFAQSGEIAAQESITKIQALVAKLVKPRDGWTTGN